MFKGFNKTNNGELAEDTCIHTASLDKSIPCAVISSNYPHQCKYAMCPPHKRLPPPVFCLGSAPLFSCAVINFTYIDP